LSKQREREEANLMMKMSTVDDGDARFTQACQEDIERRKADGKAVYPLLKALTFQHSK
jgi:hypothetical protein